MADQDLDCRKDQYGGPDRRRFPRMRATIVEYAPSQNEGVRTLSFTENISEGGICIFAAQEFQTGSDLSLRIFIPYYHEPLPAKGKIVWRRQSPFLDMKGETNFDIGIEFTEIDEEDRKNIISYIRKYSHGNEIRVRNSEITFQTQD